MKYVYFYNASLDIDQSTVKFTGIYTSNNVISSTKDLKLLRKHIGIMSLKEYGYKGNDLIINSLSFLHNI